MGHLLLHTSIFSPSGGEISFYTLTVWCLSCWRGLPAVHPLLPSAWRWSGDRHSIKSLHPVDTKNVHKCSNTHWRLKYYWINISYCDLRGRIKGTAYTLIAIESWPYNMGNIVRTISAIKHTGYHIWQSSNYSKHAATQSPHTQYYIKETIETKCLQIWLDEQCEMNHNQKLQWNWLKHFGSRCGSKAVIRVLHGKSC